MNAAENNDIFINVKCRIQNIRYMKFKALLHNNSTLLLLLSERQTSDKNMNTDARKTYF